MIRGGTRTKRVVGIHINRTEVQLAVGMTGFNGRTRFQFERHEWFDGGDRLLSSIGRDALLEALKAVVSRWSLQGADVSVSLDNDHCVTRVVTGPSERVDRELAALEHRVPRYLWLGPGEKQAAVARQKHGSGGGEHAVAAVANRGLVQRLYRTLRDAELKPKSLEPNLCALARLVGFLEYDRDRPILVADGSGTGWDLGIVWRGQLLLDYRPAAAGSAKELRESLHSHLSRLRRFCQRHRGLPDARLDQLWLFGPDEDVSTATKALQGFNALEVHAFSVPMQAELWDIAQPAAVPAQAAAFAAVLPSMVQDTTYSIPDLLGEIRKQREMSRAEKVVRWSWPAIAAGLLLSATFVGLQFERYRTGTQLVDQQTLEEQVQKQRQIVQATLERRQLCDQLVKVDQQMVQFDFERLLIAVARCLPDEAKLEQFVVESPTSVHLNGSVMDEKFVYELVGWLRQLPDVAEVSLEGTSPSEDNAAGLRFDLRLKLGQRETATVSVEASSGEVAS
jgi:hypothetical protein